MILARPLAPLVRAEQGDCTFAPFTLAGDAGCGFVLFALIAKFDEVAARSSHNRSPRAD
jgi:hypothetical protein